jgi:uncharacterized membrane protein
LSNTNGQKLQQVTQIQQQVQTIFDPEVVRKYAELVPDAPERILAVFEKNAEAERNLRQAQLDANKEINQFQHSDNRRRDWMAFIIILSAIGASALFAFVGFEWLSGATLLGLAAWVVKGYLMKEKNKPTSAQNP